MMLVIIRFAGTDFLLEGTYVPFRPGFQFYPNGVPGYPAEPAEFEIEGVFLIDAETKLIGSTSIKDIFEGMYFTPTKARVLDLFEQLAITKLEGVQHG